MCFCLLSVTAYRFEFCLLGEAVDIRIFDIFMIFVIISRIYSCAKDWESALDLFNRFGQYLVVVIVFFRLF